MSDNRLGKTVRALVKHPVFYMQTAHALFILQFVYGVEFYGCLGAGVLAYALVVLCCTGPVYIRWQRNFLNSIRKVLADHFQLKRLQGIQKDDWDSLEGAIKFSRGSVMLCLVLIATYVAEGRYVGGFNLSLNCIFFYIASQSKSPEITLFTGRFNAFLHLLHAASFGSAFGMSAVRRMLISRSLVAMAYIESIPELFVSIVVLPCCYIMFRFGCDSPILILPFIHFFITVLPVEIIGLRLWLLRKAHETRYVSPSTYVAMVIMLLPLTMAMTSFNVGGGNDLLLLDAIASSSNALLNAMKEAAISHDAAIPVYLVNFFPLAGLIIAASWKLWSGTLDGWIQSVSANPGMARTRRINSAVDDEKFDVTMAAWMTTLAIVALYTDPLVIIPGVFMIVFSHRLSGDHDVERTALLAFHMWMSLYITSFKRDGLHLLLTGARLWLCFEDRAFSDIFAEATFASSFQVLLVPSLVVRKGVFSIFAWGLVVGLSLRLIRDNVDRFVNEVKAADSFLDHALKQRFAAMSSVMQHAMETSWKIMTSSLRRTLSQATFETQLALAACHLSSAALRYESGSFVPLVTGKAQNVVAMIRTWKEDHAFFSVVPVEGEEWIEANLDYDLLHYLMADMLRPYVAHCLDMIERLRRGEDVDHHPLKMPVKILVHRSGPQTFVIKLETPTNLDELGPKQELLLSIRESVAKALGGKLGLKGNSIQFRLTHHAFASHRHSSSSPGSSSSDLLPSNWHAGNCQSSASSLIRSTGVGSPQGMSGEHLLERMSTFVHSDHDTTAPGQVQSAEIDHHMTTLPKNLVIAVLDDNSLVRRSLMFTIRMHIKADVVKSFAMGGTKEESLQFPVVIMDKDVQIALFDENLEYDDGETLKGSTLAARARKLGYKGCLVLHSANSALEETLDPCFDGFVAKTASKEQFIRNLASVYQRYLARVMFAGHRHHHAAGSSIPDRGRKSVSSTSVLDE